MKNRIERKDRIPKDTAIVVPDLPAKQKYSYALHEGIRSIHYFIILANLSTVAAI